MIHKFEDFTLNELKDGVRILNPSKLYATIWREYDLLLEKVMEVYDLDEHEALINISNISKYKTELKYKSNGSFKEI